jgi:uncharacterized phiE125 gp8 family phage protein
MKPSLEIPPAALAVDWETEVKSQLRLNTDEERARVESLLIPTATAFMEAHTSRQFITATWVFRYSSFAEALAGQATIAIPRPPLQTLEWIKYYDASNDLQTWDATNYDVVISKGPNAPAAWIQPTAREYYPSTYAREDALEIRAVCGYGPDYSDVPPLLRQSLLTLIGELFERREHGSTEEITPVPLGAISLGLPYVGQW